MMLCIGACIALLIFGAAFHRKAVWQKIRSPCRILLVFSVLGILAEATDRFSFDAVESGQIKRYAPGGGDLETEARFFLGQEETEYTVALTVPERKYSKKEEKELALAAIAEIDETFCGANNSLAEIVFNPDVRESYQDGAVSAEWMFSNNDIISADGEICQEALRGQKEEIEAFVTLRCGETEEYDSFAFWVVPIAKSKQEKWVQAIEEQIARQDETDAVVTLPDEIDGEKIHWKSARSFQSAEILGLGILAAVAAAYASKERRERQIQKRKREMLLSYPEFAGKLSLLLGAGMTISAALRNMNRMYQRRVARGGRREAVYEELYGMICKMDNGMGEIRAYQNFSEQCDLQPYRKLVSLLISGQKAGNRKLTEQLSEEADRVFLERKNAARRIGEEAGTKLLLPMMMMLVIVMGIVAIPAFLTIYGT